MPTDAAPSWCSIPGAWGWRHPHAIARPCATCSSARPPGQCNKSVGNAQSCSDSHALRSKLAACRGRPGYSDAACCRTPAWRCGPARLWHGVVETWATAGQFIRYLCMVPCAGPPVRPCQHGHAGRGVCACEDTGRPCWSWGCPWVSADRPPWGAAHASQALLRRAIRVTAESGVIVLGSLWQTWEHRWSFIRDLPAWPVLLMGPLAGTWPLFARSARMAGIPAGAATGAVERCNFSRRLHHRDD